MNTPPNARLWLDVLDLRQSAVELATSAATGRSYMILRRRLRDFFGRGLPIDATHSGLMMRRFTNPG